MFQRLGIPFQRKNNFERAIPRVKSTSSEVEFSFFFSLFSDRYRGSSFLTQSIEARERGRERAHKVSDINASFITAAFHFFSIAFRVESVKKRRQAEWRASSSRVSKWKNTFPESRCNETLHTLWCAYLTYKPYIARGNLMSAKWKKKIAIFHRDNLHSSWCIVTFSWLTVETKLSVSLCVMHAKISLFFFFSFSTR